MKRILGLVAVGLMIGSTAAYSQSEGPLFGPVTPISPVAPLAADQPIVVTQATQPEATPLQPVPEGAPVPMISGCELFPCVKYKNLGKVAPCAVEMIVSIKDPCGCRKDPCNGCVNVKICVPPCESCPAVKVKRCGDKIRYDYGKYAIELTAKKGEVVVAYHKGLF